LVTIPHISFFEGSTPVKQLQQVGNLFPNSSLWLKTEDISDVTGLYSGNKRRKLEFEFAQAVHGVQKPLLPLVMPVPIIALLLQICKTIRTLLCLHVKT